MPVLAFGSSDMTWELFQHKLDNMGGMVEEFIEGADKRSPSAPYRVDLFGDVQPTSTNDHVLSGPRGQIFLGCRFPVDESYRLDIQECGMRVARLLSEKGVRGRFGIDFLSVPQPTGWRHLAIEVNLRKGGTTHTFDMLHFLTDGTTIVARGCLEAAP